MQGPQGVLFISSGLSQYDGPLEQLTVKLSSLKLTSVHLAFPLVVSYRIALYTSLRVSVTKNDTTNMYKQSGNLLNIHLWIILMLVKLDGCMNSVVWLHPLECA